MSTMRLLVAYDGTSLSGFQGQPGRRTVQGVLEAALERLSARPVRVVGAGRTDAGVHAVGQVVSCPRPRELDDEHVLRALAGVLPADVSALDCAEADPGFHPRHDASWRSYTYLIWSHPSAHPLLSRFSTWTNRPIDVDALDAALAVFVGTYDFSAFARVREDQSPVRTVLAAAAEAEGPLIRVTVRATSFLHQMVRSMVGSALEVAGGRRSRDWLEAALLGGHRSSAGPVAAPAGLTLVEVRYDGLAWDRPQTRWPWARADALVLAS